MKTAVIYARYSSERQTEQSIEGQIRECTEFAVLSNKYYCNFNRNLTLIIDLCYNEENKVLECIK